MRAVCYARVSSAGQRDRDTIASQIRVLPEFIAAKGWTLVRPVETYVDNGKSARAGRLQFRNGLSALLRDAALHLFDVVCVVDVDRLTRSEDLAERGAILGAFQAAGVKVAAAMTGEVLDLSTEAGDLFGTLRAFFAAAESRKKRERTMLGCETAARRGRKVYGPTPYGLTFSVVTGEWAFDSIAAPIVREMFERIAGGESCSVVALDLELRGVPRPRGAWRRNRVQEIIRARYPLGEIVLHRKKNILATVPALVDAVLWERAQEQMKRHRRSGLRRTRHVYLLEGIAACGVCGSPMHIRSADGAHGVRSRVASYVCSERRGMKLGGMRCPGLYVSQPDVDDRVWRAVCRELEDPAIIPAIAMVRHDRVADRQVWQDDVAGYERHLQRLERAEQTLLSRFTRGLVSEKALDAELADVHRRRITVQEQIDTAKRASGSAQRAQDQLQGAAAMIMGLRSRLPDADPALRRELVRLLVEPGSVVFRGRDVRLSLAVPRSSGASGLSGPETGTFAGTNAPLRIRLVA